MSCTWLIYFVSKGLVSISTGSNEHAVNCFSTCVPAPLKLRFQHAEAASVHHNDLF